MQFQLEDRVHLLMLVIEHSVDAYGQALNSQALKVHVSTNIMLRTY